MNYKLLKSIVIMATIAVPGMILAAAEPLQSESIRKSSVERWLMELYETPTTLRGHTGAIRAVVVTPDGSTIVTGSDDRTIRIWDRETGSIRVLQANLPITALAITPNGLKLIAGSKDGTVQIWSMVNYDRLLNFKAHSKKISAIAPTPDGLNFVTGSEDSMAKVWTVEIGQLIRTFQADSSIRSLALTPDGLTVVAVLWADRPMIWGLTTGATRVGIDVEGPMNAVAITPDGSNIVVGMGHGDFEAIVGGIRTNNIIRRLIGHEGPINAIAITPDGFNVVTGSLDTSARIWDIETGEQLRILLGNTGPLFSVAITPDGYCVVTGSSSGIAKIWNIWDLGAELRALSQEQLDLLSWIHRQAMQGQKADLTVEANIAYFEQYVLLPDLMRDLIAEYVIVQ